VETLKIHALLKRRHVRNNDERRSHDGVVQLASRFVALR